MPAHEGLAQITVIARTVRPRRRRSTYGPATVARVVAELP